MFLKIDFSSAIPMYAQLKEQIILGIASGKLEPGSKLPSVREVSTELRINPSTITQAYKELEYEKMIFTKKGQGTFVCENQTRISSVERDKILVSDMKKIINKAMKLGIEKSELVNLFINTLDNIQDYSNDKKEGKNE